MHHSLIRYWVKIVLFDKRISLECTRGSIVVPSEAMKQIASEHQTPIFGKGLCWCLASIGLHLGDGSYDGVTILTLAFPRVYPLRDMVH